MSKERKTGVFKFRAEDMIWLLEDGVKEYSLKFLPHEHINDVAQQREESGTCLTGFVDGRIVGCGGVDTIHPGVGEVFVMLSYEVDKDPIRAYEVIRDGLEQLMEGFHRLEGWCRVDFVKGHTLFRHLNFKVEGRASKRSMDKTDMILYSRTE